jgi:HD-like signal output (HDOD) protein
MSTIYSANDLPQALQKFHGQIRIAPLGMNIHVLMHALADADMDHRQLTAVLHHYPVITARLIALANSAWICPATPITSIETACIRLGHSIIKSVSIAIAVASSFNTARCPMFDPIRFWTTSMLVADGAGLLAAKLPKTASSQDLQYSAQTAGIVHNLGLLWLADNLAGETAAALQLAVADPALTVNQALTQHVGIDYCRVGAWIGQQWQMPNELIAVMQHHRDVHYQEHSSVLVKLVGAAARMISAMVHGRDDMPENDELHGLGIDIALQRAVFKQLALKFESTQQLAKALFL